MKQIYWIYLITALFLLLGILYFVKDKTEVESVPVKIPSKIFEDSQNNTQDQNNMPPKDNFKSN